MVQCGGVWWDVLLVGCCGWWSVEVEVGCLRVRFGVELERAWQAVRQYCARGSEGDEMVYGNRGVRGYGRYTAKIAV